MNLSPPDLVSCSINLCVSLPRGLIRADIRVMQSQGHLRAIIWLGLGQRQGHVRAKIWRVYGRLEQCATVVALGLLRAGRIMSSGSALISLGRALSFCGVAGLA